MADSSVAVTPGAGAAVDTRTQAGGDHRQVVVLGDADAAATVLVTAAGSLATLIRPDTARTPVTIRYSATAPPTTETVVSVVPVRAFVDGTAVTTVPVTAGKTLRITNVIVVVRTTTGAQPWVRATLRVNPAAAAVIGSPAVLTVGASGNTATAGNSSTQSVACELDVTGTQQLALSIAGNVATNAVDVTLLGYEV